jgi:hypothetical protein
MAPDLQDQKDDLIEGEADDRSQVNISDDGEDGDLMLKRSVSPVWLQDQLQSENGTFPASHCTILDSYRNRVSACVCRRGLVTNDSSTKHRCYGASRAPKLTTTLLQHASMHISVINVTCTCTLVEFADARCSRADLLNTCSVSKHPQPRNVIQ